MSETLRKQRPREWREGFISLVIRDFYRTEESWNVAHTTTSMRLRAFTSRSLFLSVRRARDRARVSPTLHAIFLSAREVLTPHHCCEIRQCALFSLRSYHRDFPGIILSCRGQSSRYPGRNEHLVPITVRRNTCVYFSWIHPGEKEIGRKCKRTRLFFYLDVLRRIRVLGFTLSFSCFAKTSASTYTGETCDITRKTVTHASRTRLVLGDT